MKMKLLRLSLTLVIGAFLAGSAFAQGQEVDMKTPKNKHVGEVPSPVSNQSLNKAAYSNWKFPFDAAETIGGTFERYVNFLFEDTLAVYASADNDPFHWSNIAVGGVFDPTDVNFEVYDDGIRLSRFNAYTVDSVYVPYLYVRNVDSIDLGNGMEEVVDTLVFQFYDYNQLVYGTFGSNGEVFAKSSEFTRANYGNSNYAYEVKMPLTAADSTSYSETGWGTRGMIIDVPNVAIPEDYALQGRRVCGFNIAFKTMLPYSMGDTVIAVDGIEPAKQLNYFGHLYYLNVGTDVAQEEYYNNSFWTFGDHLYGQDINGWENSIPGNAFFDDRYVYFAVHVNTLTLGVDDLNSNMSFAVYPNPVSRTETLKLDFSLVNADDVTIEMYDLLGNKVKEVASGYYTSGEHKIDLDINDLTPGVYVYSVQAGNVKTSKKITITQ